MGHTLVPMLAEDATPADTAARTGFSPDLVVIEPFGNNIPLPDFRDCECPVAAYCVDASLNAFWLVHYLKNVDHVFVDQHVTVERLKRHGITAVWLPLCVSDEDFRQPAKKKHLISFVGRLTSFRTKRSNLLGHIAASFPVNHVQGVSQAEMQDIHASSHIVLNENFFPGLTLRPFQAVASGGLLLTESSSLGLGAYFNEGEQYLPYGPDDILKQIERVKKTPAQWEEQARTAQEKCRQRHTSTTCAAELLRVCVEKADQNNSGRVESASSKAWHEAYARYLFCLRFGGLFGKHVSMIRNVAVAEHPESDFARYALGCIHAGNGRLSKAAEAFEAVGSDAVETALPARMKLALVAARLDDLNGARHHFEETLSRFSELSLYPAISTEVLSFQSREEALFSMHLVFAQLLAAKGCFSELGFEKSQPDFSPTQLWSLLNFPGSNCRPHMPWRS